MLRIGIRRCSMKTMIKRERMSLIYLMCAEGLREMTMEHVLWMDLKCGV